MKASRGAGYLSILAVGVLAIQSSLKAPATVALAAPMAVLIIPILDTSAAIIRRNLTGRSIYCSDRGHLHRSRPVRTRPEGRHEARRGLHPDRLRRPHRLDRRITFGHR